MGPTCRGLCSPERGSWSSAGTPGWAGCSGWSCWKLWNASESRSPARPKGRHQRQVGGGGGRASVTRGPPSPATRPMSSCDFPPVRTEAARLSREAQSTPNAHRPLAMQVALTQKLRRLRASGTLEPATPATGFATAADSERAVAPVPDSAPRSTHLSVVVSGRGVAALVHASGRQRALGRGGQGLPLRAVAAPGELSLQRAAVLCRRPCGTAGRWHSTRAGGDDRPPFPRPQVPAPPPA